MAVRCDAGNADPVPRAPLKRHTLHRQVQISLLLHTSGDISHVEYQCSSTLWQHKRHYSVVVCG